MVVQSLEDLSIDKVFVVGLHFLSNRLFEDFRLYIKDILFAERLSQKLLRKILMHDCGLLCYFAPLLYSLSNITLQSTKFENYEFLKQFNLSSFSCKSMKLMDIDDLLKNFNEKTKTKMRYLRLRKIRIRNESLLLLPRFMNIKFLDLSYTNLVTSSLKQICYLMRSLVGLNISSTGVDDLWSLRCLSNQLEFLDIHDLSPKAHTNIFSIIEDMEKLRHLDLGVAEFAKTNLGNDTTIQSCRCLSSLRLLDLSGHQDNLSTHLIISILLRMPNLKYFIYNRHSSWYASNNDSKFKRFIKRRTQLTVMGAFSKQTLLSSLIYSLENRRYLSISLHQLYDKTCISSFISDTLNTTIVEHLSHISIKKNDHLVAITAVVYNLTKNQLTEKWNPDHLSEVVNRLISFLEISDISEQLAVNIFLVICNDFIIQKVSYEKVRLAQLVFKTIEKFETTNIKQSGVIIISIIASELSKTELNTLVSDVSNFRNLLTIVCSRCVFQSDLANISKDCYLTDLRSSLRLSGEPIFDYTLKFTLGSLWNLTDECTLACQQFVEQQGLVIYFVMIDRFRNTLPDIYAHICNKCLGLLNNIAEEETCRAALLSQQYMDFLMEMLDQEDIQMTYFAGGILSNLLLISDEKWEGRCKQDKDFYENRIYVAVVSWVSPNYLMASYRSFCPFENLIANAGSSRAILLWALWAIRHTLKIERSRYRSILAKHCQLVEYIDLLAVNHNPFYSRIRTMAADILVLFNQDDGDNDVIYQMMVE